MQRVVILGSVILIAAILGFMFFGSTTEGHVKLHPRYRVITPDNYDPDKGYPLLLVLHGENSTLEDMIPHFQLDKYRGDYLLGFLQSTERSMFGFTWQNGTEKDWQEIEYCYRHIIDEYSVDADRVIIGGFSAGGTMAIDIMLNEVIPVLGFVAGCPGKPTDLNAAALQRAAKAGKKGVIIAGEKDYCLNEQREMAHAFQNAGFKYLYTVIPGIGHRPPDNLPRLLDKAVEFIDSEIGSSLASSYISKY